MRFPSPKRFTIRRELGEGGMGVVYEAFDEERRAVVALKTMRAPTADALARFKREFRVMQDVQHPNLVSLGELVSEGDDCFFTMELVEGGSFLSYARPASLEDDPQASGVHTEGAALGFASTKKMPTVPVAREHGRDVITGYDEARLRASLVQLAEALTALHAAGMVHRDVKPSNVRVTREGRVVLLDFGLVSDVGPAQQSGLQFAVGTPAYMAPEQAALRPVGPEADWYSVGVMLYEALTGSLPFEGAPLAILIAKQQHEPAPPSTLGPDIPPDLEALCVALLRTDPNARPKARDVLRVLAVEGATSAALAHSDTVAAPFIGREAEDRALHEAFRESAERAAVAVFLEGESGVGKSSLVRRFTDALAREDPQVVVLHGRCYERESVPYKAFDGVVDALARYLKYLPADEIRAILPARPAPLVQVFPVLRRVAPIAEMLAQAEIRATDPLELRSRAFAALRETLTRLGDRRRLVLVIDDVQWADADSVALVGEILRRPVAPRLLFLATVRTSGTKDGDVPIRRAVDAATRTIQVARLSRPQSVALAEALLQRAAPARSADAESIAKEAEGHPLFIDALVRHSALQLERGSGPLRLEDALWSPIAALDEPTRRLLQILAAAGAPLTQEVLQTAADATPSDFAKRASVLRVAHLASISGARASDTIEPYHDKVRMAVLAHLDDEMKERCHRSLAMALETTRAHDAEALATHWLGAGERALAGKYYAVAGDDATSALAFDRAAHLYERALDLGAFAGADERAIWTKLGDALASAGRGARAAVAYEAAIPGASAAQGLELRRRRAEQFLMSGYIDDGMQAIVAVLVLVRLWLPSRAWTALAYALVLRICLRLRGLGFRQRDASQVAPERLTRIDVCWSVSLGLALVDHVRAAAFQARHLLFALRAGEPSRIVRALTNEIAFVGCGGTRTWARTLAVHERATALVKTANLGPNAEATLHGCMGLALACRGDYRASLELIATSERTLREQGTGNVVWELNSLRMFMLLCLARLGELGELCTKQPLFVREAHERGNLYAEVNFRVGHGSLAWLVADDPASAHADVADAMRSWSNRGFHVEHYYELLAQTQIDLYQGNGPEAYDRFAATRPALRRSLLWTIQGFEIESAELRGRSALAKAESRPADRSALLRVASRDARVIERERAPWGMPVAKLLRAGVANVSNDGDERVVVLLREALTGFEATNMALPAAATRRCLGAVIGGDEGRGLIDEAVAWMTSQRVQDPSRMTAMVAAGFSRAL